MGTESEQLLELRQAIVLDKLKGKSQTLQSMVLKNLRRMTFNSGEEFNNWIKESFDDEPKKTLEATDEEIDVIIDRIMPSSAKTDVKSSPINKDTDVDSLLNVIMP